jgi:hypothetical protein
MSVESVNVRRAAFYAKNGRMPDEAELESIRGTQIRDLPVGGTIE